MITIGSQPEAAHTQDLHSEKSSEQFGMSPQAAITTEEIEKRIEPHKGFGYLQTAAFSRWGRKIFVVWYCPYSGRAATYVSAYNFDSQKRQWIKFLDRLIEGSHDLSAEMPTGDFLILRGSNGEIAVKESLAKFPATVQ